MAAQYDRAAVKLLAAVSSVAADRTVTTYNSNVRYQQTLRHLGRRGRFRRPLIRSRRALVRLTEFEALSALRALREKCANKVALPARAYGL